MKPDEATGADEPNNVTQTVAPDWAAQAAARSGNDNTALPQKAGAASFSSTAPIAFSSGSLTSVGATGTSVFGQYELIAEVARGGMGVVYKARQRGLDRLVALKMVLGVSHDHEASLQRFILEARSAASLDHPNVVPIYDSGEIDGKLYFTMALVEGPNLKSYVESHGVPPIPEAVSLFSQIVAGVAHAHQQGIIHRDLKPANVLMDKDGRPRVTDFGLAKRSTGVSELTGTGQVMGTPAYMPPEQARDSKDVGPPADVYSLGAILYFLLTGRPPFVGESVPDLLIKVVSEAPVPPSQINREVPPELEEVCLRCLSKLPGDRYPDARGLAEGMLVVLERYLPRSAHSLPSMGRTSDMLGLPATSRSGANVSGLSNTALSDVSAAPVAPAGRGRRRVIALSAAAGLLAAVALYLAVLRPPKKVEPQGDAGTVAAATGGAQTPAHGTTAQAGAPETLAWPPIGTNDFDIKAQFVDASSTDSGGIIQLPNKTVLKIKLRADRDCRAAVYWIDPAGQITQLFPNKHDLDGALVAGQERVIPGGGKSYELETIPTEGGGTEKLRVVATTGNLSPSLTATDAGPFAQYQSPDERRKLVSHVRGIVVKKSNPEEGAAKVAEAEMRFRVNP